jgi:hypothetical protein
LIQEEVRHVTNLIRDHLAAMTLSEVINQLEVGDSIAEIMRTLQAEVEEDTHDKFTNKLRQIRIDTMAQLKEEVHQEAKLEAEAQKDNWNLKFRIKHREVAESKAWNEQYEHFSVAHAKNPMVLAKAKAVAKKTADRKYADALDKCRTANKQLIDQELRPELELYKSQKQGQLMLQADQLVHTEERDLIYKAVVLGIIDPSKLTSLPPMPKWSRREPQS